MTPNSAPDRLCWYVGCVRSCQEKNVAEALGKRSVEYYLPLRREVHRWSDRRKVVECLVLPRYIFVRCTDAQRRSILAEDSRIVRFLSSGGEVSVVRDAEMEAFRLMVEKGSGTVRVSDSPLSAGDRVRVLSGPLAGLECELLEVGGGRCIAVRLGTFGTATMDLDVDTVEKI